MERKMEEKREGRRGKEIEDEEHIRNEGPGIRG